MMSENLDNSKNANYQGYDLLPSCNRADTFARLEMAALCMIKQKPVKSNLKRPIISFSFDDCPKTAITIGADILEKYDISGTYYLTGGHINQNFEDKQQYECSDLRRLYQNGHEIACHSFSHPRMRRRCKNAIIKDIDKNRNFFAKVLDIDPETLNLESFAYPYGEFDHELRKIIGQKFVSARGVYRGINHGIIDFSNLRTTPLEKRRYSREYLEKHLENAISKNGWAIFFTHEIQDDCSLYGSTPEILEEAIIISKEMGFDIMNVKSAAKKILEG